MLAMPRALAATLGVRTIDDLAAHAGALRIGAEDVLRRVFGYSAFRGLQSDVIRHMAGGGDALVIMPTGGGKSLCYQIPAIMRPGVGIVILATILDSVGVPAAGIAIILGGDRLLDMCRTVVNVTGDLAACVVLDRLFAEKPDA